MEILAKRDEDTKAAAFWDSGVAAGVWFQEFCFGEFGTQSLPLFDGLFYLGCLQAICGPNGPVRFSIGLWTLIGRLNCQVPHL